MNTSPITMTDAAAAQIKQKMESNPESIGLRLTAGKTGCSGNSYRMDHVLEEDLTKDDKFEHNGATLYISKIESWMFFGTEIDYKSDTLSSGFTFDNPNEAARCGCGESFKVERPLDSPKPPQ